MKMSKCSLYMYRLSAYFLFMGEEFIPLLTVTARKQRFFADITASLKFKRMQKGLCYCTVPLNCKYGSHKTKTFLSVFFLSSPSLVQGRNCLFLGNRANFFFSLSLSTRLSGTGKIFYFSSFRFQAGAFFRLTPESRSVNVCWLH